ncbi:MAG: zf-HC2 domain-containing protein [candidate division WOR-3 bacterium]
MKNCSQEKVLFYLEGMLSEKESEDFFSHLETCGECQKELKRIQRLKEILANERKEIPEPNLSRILSDFRRKRLAKRIKPERRFSWRLVFLPVGALAIILFLFLFRPFPPTADKATEVYLPVDLSYYEIIENIPSEVKEELGTRLLTKSDLEKLEGEILSGFDYFALLEELDKKEKEVLVENLIGGGDL